MLISCLLVALIHIRLDFLLYFILISHVANLGFNLGFDDFLLISCKFTWLKLRLAL